MSFYGCLVSGFWSIVKGRIRIWIRFISCRLIHVKNSDIHILILIMPKIHEHYWSTLNACQIDTDPDQAYHFDEDLDPHPAYHFDTDPNPNFQFDADPAPAPQH